MRDKCLCFLGCLIGFSAFAFRVPSAVAAADAPAAMMKAGAAKVAITPGAASLKELTTVMGTKATQIDHDIYARALVLNDGTSRLAIVTYDLNCLDVATPILRVRCRDRVEDPAVALDFDGDAQSCRSDSDLPGKLRLWPRAGRQDFRSDQRSDRQRRRSRARLTRAGAQLPHPRRRQCAG